MSIDLYRIRAAAEVLHKLADELKAELGARWEFGFAIDEYDAQAVITVDESLLALVRVAEAAITWDKGPILASREAERQVRVALHEAVRALEE